VIALAAVLAICYVAKLLMITLLTSILLAFVLSPAVDRLEMWRLPRSIASFFVVVALLAVIYGIVHFSYSQAVSFSQELPKYSQKIRDATVGLRRQAEQLQKTTEKVLPRPADGEDKTLKVRPAANLSDWLTNSVWDVGEFVLAISFVPFLVYFMLSWKDRTRAATVKLFRPESREAVYATLSGIGSMFRAFAVGNALCGFFMSLVSVAAFGLLGLPYFYFLGFISGFLSLIPYLGVVLAVVPHIAVGLSEVSGARLLALFVIIVGLHLFTINVLFPKVIGKRLHLNPLIVTIGLFVWSSIWGAMGLILAVPITGAMKIILDHVDGLRPFGAWMEE